MPERAATPDETPQPFFQLQCGGVHLTIQNRPRLRLRAWLVSIGAPIVTVVTVWRANR